MLKYKPGLLFIFTCVISYTLSAQSSLIRVFSGEPAKPESFVLALPDGGFVAATGIYSKKTGGGFLFVRYDACDSLVWSRKYWNTQHALVFADLTRTNDGHFLMCGFYNHMEDYQGFLFKIDANGDLVFSNTFETGVNEYIYSVGEMNDGNYFIYGNRNDVNLPYSTNFILKFAPDGTILGGKSYFDIPIWGRTITTSDGGILARTGRVIYKLDSQGNFIWGRELSGAGYYESKPIEVDGGYIYARYSTSYLADNPSYIFKLDYNGDLAWVSEGFRSTNGNGIYDVTGLVELENGDLLVPGNIILDGTSNNDYCIIYTRLDNKGKILGQWLQSPGRKESHRYHDISIGKGGVVYVAGNVILDQTLTITKLLTTDGVEGCELVPIATSIPEEPLTLSPMSVQPQDVSGTITPLTLAVDEVDPLATDRCYTREEISMSIGPDTVLCPGEKITIGSDREFAFYNWSNGANERYIEADHAGTYILEAGDGCNFVKDTMVLAYYPEITPEFSVSPLFTNSLTPVHFKSGLSSGFQWIFNDTVSKEGDFFYYFNRNGRYPVIFQMNDTNGCAQGDTIYIDVKYVSIYIPNAFTADGDGLNDGFKPEGFGIATYQTEIFTRWGEKIYSQRDGAWDGTHDGKKMPVGVYVYEITVTDDFGEETFKRGLVTLVR